MNSISVIYIYQIHLYSLLSQGGQQVEISIRFRIGHQKEPQQRTQ